MGEGGGGLVSKGIRHLSFKATMACVFIQSFALELSLSVCRNHKP